MDYEDGYGTESLHRRRRATGASPKKTQGPSLNLCGWKIIFAVLLATSLALKLTLLFILLQPVFQESSSKTDFGSAVSFRSCELAHRDLTENLTLDPDTAHDKLVLSKNGKRVQREKHREHTLPLNLKRFDYLLSVLTHEGFTSGKHCWKVDTMNGSYWAMGVARETVRRKGRLNITPKDGIWAVQRWAGEYQVLTSPVLELSLRNVPIIVWVYLDYEEEKVAFFNAVTEDPIFTFSNALFSGERVLPWFAVWGSNFHLTLLP